jgi:hypothetical protein
MIKLIKTVKGEEIEMNFEDSYAENLLKTDKRYRLADPQGDDPQGDDPQGDDPQGDGEDTE